MQTRSRTKKNHSPVDLFASVGNDGVIYVSDRINKSSHSFDEFKEKYGVSFLYIGKRFFLHGMDTDTDLWYSSTPYDYREDEISIYPVNDYRNPIFTGKRGSDDCKKKIKLLGLSTSMIVFALGAELDGKGKLIQFIFPPYTRSKFFDFEESLKAKGIEYSDFVVGKPTSHIVVNKRTGEEEEVKQLSLNFSPANVLLSETLGVELEAAERNILEYNGFKIAEDNEGKDLPEMGGEIVDGLEF